MASDVATVPSQSRNIHLISSALKEPISVRSSSSPGTLGSAEEPNRRKAYPHRADYGVADRRQR
jgi:hypothetical protein